MDKNYQITFRIFRDRSHQNNIGVQTTEAGGTKINSFVYKSHYR